MIIGSDNFDFEGKDANKWHRSALVKLAKEEKKHLKVDLVQIQRDHILKHKEGDSDTWFYLQRMAQFHHQKDKGSRLGIY